MSLGVTENNSVEQELIIQKKLAFSVEEISESTSLSKAFLRNEIRAGKLKANRFGRRVLVLTENLEKYLKQEEK